MMNSSNMSPVAKQMALLLHHTEFDLSRALSLAEVADSSLAASKQVIAIMEDIFLNEKSARILTAVRLLQILVKNCHRGFHLNANSASFQKALLGLLKHSRGRANSLKDIRSNLANWSEIEAVCLYVIQLWYDALMLEESRYPFIIGIYKTLRKEGIKFPPRSQHEPNLMAISTASPIFAHIQELASKPEPKRWLGQASRLEAAEDIVMSELEQITEQIARIETAPSEMTISLSQDSDCLRRFLTNFDPSRIPAGQMDTFQLVCTAAERALKLFDASYSEQIQKKEADYFKRRDDSSATVSEKSNNKETIISHDISRTTSPDHSKDASLPGSIKFELNLLD